MPDILITENISGRWLDELKAKYSVVVEPTLWKTPDKIKAALPGCRALIVRNQTKVNADLLSAADKLEVTWAPTTEPTAKAEESSPNVAAP